MDDLKAKIEALAKSDFKHRLSRAESWLRRGYAESDADAKFIFLWIAFNAAYAVRGQHRKDWECRSTYFDALAPLDAKQRIYGLLSTELLSPVQDMMNNMYVFHGFWNKLPEPPIDWLNWPGKPQFDEDSEFVADRLANGTSPVANELAAMLHRVFSRVSVLRNQLMHGCAT